MRVLDLICRDTIYNVVNLPRFKIGSDEWRCNDDE